MNHINVDLTKENNIYSRVIGGQGEQKNTMLVIKVPEEYYDWACYFDFENSAGEKYRRISDNFVDGIGTYEFTAYDTRFRGNFLIDLVLIKDDKVAKPFSDTFVIKTKICADSTENYTPIILEPDAALDNDDIDKLLSS